MRIVIFTIVFILSVIYCPKAHSLQEFNNEGRYFSFTMLTNTLTDGQETKIIFDWNIRDFDMTGQKRLTVRPLISAGSIEIYNQDLDLFIGIADFNSRLPYIQKEMLVRFLGVQSSEDPILLNFIVYDTLTGKNYVTATKELWGTAYYKKYINILNENIIKSTYNNETHVVLKTNDTEPEKNKSRDPAILYLWYLSPAFFLYGLLKSSNGFG